jgi:methionyl-tRNA formyltransferase
MRIVFIGTGEIGVPTLRALQTSSEHELVGIVTQPDKPVGRDQKITAPPIKAALTEAKMPILQPKRIKDRPAIEKIRSLRPDVIVVMAYGQILPRDVLQLPPVACLNLHASLLPRWRGAAPIQAAIAAGDHETGITVMYMNEGLDTGDILLQRKIDISPTDTGGLLHDHLGEIAPAALLESLSLLPSKNAPRVPQDEVHATVAPKLDREDGRIDWMEPAEVIERKIRAFNPWPGAFTVLAGTPNKPRKLKIFSASIVDLSGQPGEILRRKNEIVIATGMRSLSLEEVQLEGKERMSADEFMRGFPSDGWIDRSAGGVK